MSTPPPLGRLRGGWVTVLAVLGLVAVVSSCTVLRRGAADPREPRVTVEVVNQNIHDATIFMFVDGTRTQLGTVPANSTRTVSAPYPVGGRMSVEVRLIPVGSYASWPLNVEPGRTVTVSIPANLHRHGASFPR